MFFENIFKIGFIADLYDRDTRKMEIEDERLLPELLDKYGKIVVVDLGCGTGREFPLLLKSPNVVKIIGIDFSYPMLRIAKDKWASDDRIELLDDDIRSLKKFKRNKIKNKCVFLLLCNTLGNLKETDRKKAVQRIFEKMIPGDVFIAYLRKPKGKGRIWQDRVSIQVEAIEYLLINGLWKVAWDILGKHPNFYYDSKRRDVVVKAGGEELFISHRFTEDEIRELFSKFKTKIIPGKSFWIVVAEKK